MEGNMNFKSCLILPVLFLSGQLFSQNSSENYNVLLLSADYTSNTNTFGITMPVKQPNYFGTISFLSKYGFDISYTGIINVNSDSTFSKATFEHDIIAGYSFGLGKKWSVYPSYMHMFQSKDSYALISSFTDAFQNDISFLGKYYNFNLSTSYILGQKNMFFCSLQNVFNYTKDDFIVKNSSLTIQLGAYINLSDNNYYNQIIYDDWDREYFSSWVQTNFPSTTYLRTEAQIVLHGLEEAKDRLQSENPDLFHSDYKITSLDFFLPVYYSVNNLMFNTTVMLNIPTSNNKFYSMENSFLISTGISYGFKL
jgi:hypothetical protein